MFLRDRHHLEVFEPHFAVGVAVELQTEFAGLFEFRVVDINDAETVQERRGAVAASRDGDRVPTVFVADRFDKFVVGAEPTATRFVFTGGVPNGRFFAVPGDFVLAAAEEPSRVDFVSAEVERAVAAPITIVDFRDEVVVVVVRNDKAVFRFRRRVFADQVAFFFVELPASRDEFVRVFDFPTGVALDEERLPFADAQILNADVFPVNRSLAAGVNLETEVAFEVDVVEEVRDRDAVDPGADRRADALDFERVPVARFVGRERFFQRFFRSRVEPNATFLVAAAAFVVNAGVVLVAGDFALVTEHTVAVFANLAAELNAGVARDGNFEVELQDEVAVFFFVNEEGVVRRVRNAFADNFAVFDLIFRRTAVFRPTVERFAVENRNETFFDVRRLSRRDREATDRRQQRDGAAEQFAHFFVLIN